METKMKRVHMQETAPIAILIDNSEHLGQIQRFRRAQVLD